MTLPFFGYPMEREGKHMEKYSEGGALAGYEFGMKLYYQALPPVIRDRMASMGLRPATFRELVEAAEQAKKVL